MNVLLTAVGRRSYLVDYFRHSVGRVGNVICANMYPDTPAMLSGDISVVTPESWRDEYPQMIVDVCKEYDVGLLFSLHDLDTYILSKQIDNLLDIGVRAILPNSQWARIALDKVLTTDVLMSAGLNTPWTAENLNNAYIALNAGTICFPLMVKSRMGFGSAGVRVCNSIEELKVIYGLAKTELEKSEITRFFPDIEGSLVIIQEYLQGEEYCIDVVNDLDGKYACHFVSHIHAMRSGESDVATIEDPELVKDVAIRISKLSHHLGIWGIDCIRIGDLLYVIDVNPRFTGDYPFHQVAGADIPSAIISWAEKREPEPNWLKSKVGVRCYKDLVPKIMQ
jgi:carbamoyl-phosphate synthase large subunit